MPSKLERLILQVTLHASRALEKALDKSEDSRNTNLTQKAFENNANFSPSPFCTSMNVKLGY